MRGGIVKGVGLLMETLEEELKACKEERDGYKSELNKLKSRLSRLEMFLSYPLPPFNFTLENFAHFKRHSLKWYSPPFYTHPLGYRLCAEVDVNGYSVGEGTHVSLLLHLLPGPFDSELKWPFRGSVTVQLLNERRDGGHHERVVMFTEDTPLVNSQHEGEMAAGWGEPLFISHSRLAYNAAADSEYLMYDRLRFSIAVITVEIS